MHIRWKIIRDPSNGTDDLGETGSVKTISAAPRAVSVAPSTAIPMLACERASFAPSPVKGLEAFDNFVFVFGEDTSETISIETHFVEGVRLAIGIRSILQHPIGVHVVATTKTTASYLCNSQWMASNRLNFDAKCESIVDHFFGIVARRKDGKEANEFETIALNFMVIAVQLFIRYNKSAKTMGGESSLEAILELISFIVGAKLNDDARHTLYQYACQQD
jgi:hypothetical protein